MMKERIPSNIQASFRSSNEIVRRADNCLAQNNECEVSNLKLLIVHQMSYTIADQIMIKIFCHC